MIQRLVTGTLVVAAAVGLSAEDGVVVDNFSISCRR
jgi:hypothetical protein